MVVIAVKVGAAVIVLLVTCKDVDAVQAAAEVALVLGKILLVQSEIAAVGDGRGTLGTRGTSEHAVQGIAAGVVIIDAGIDLKSQVLDRSDDCTELSDKDIGNGKE